MIVRNDRIEIRKFQSAHITSTTEASDQSVQFSVAELARFQLYQDSLRSPSTPITAIAESGNPNKCLVSFHLPNGSLTLEPQIT